MRRILSLFSLVLLVIGFIAAALIAWPQVRTQERAAAVRAPQQHSDAVPTPAAVLPLVQRPSTPTAAPTPMPAPTAPVPTAPVPTTPPTVPAPTAEPLNVFEGFEGALDTWQVLREVSGGVIERSDAQVRGGSYAAQLITSDGGARAAIARSFSSPATERMWEERPGVWHWQQASVYVPSATIDQLEANEYLTLGGIYPSAGGSFGWYLRVRQGGELYVVGYDANGTLREFRVYGQVPRDRWFELELGLHSQNGPGVKRAFAFLIDGDFYGWYHQGHLTTETYDRAAVGILETNHTGRLELFVDEWRVSGDGPLPHGPDNRSAAALQEQDYRNMSGIQWQIDWSTWGNNLRLHEQHGLYSEDSRLQSGRNIDRMPDLTSGWAEIEIGWPKGTPPAPASEYFGPMVGFRKEINREENLEVIPWRASDGRLYLVLEAWVGRGIILAQWPLPANQPPGEGDIIRARWEQVSAAEINVRASYYDASAGAWQHNVIDHTFDATAVGSGEEQVDYTDGYHTASSVTIDSPYYSIRRYRVGTLETYPGP